MGYLGGANFPADANQPGAFENSGTSQPKFGLRFDQDMKNGGRFLYEGGYYGTEGIVHTGIGPFRLESGSYMAYGRVAYTKGALRINAVLAHVQDKPDEKAAGLELILQDEFQDHTFMFDPEQVADFLVGLETVRAASETMRDPPQDVGRRAVFNLNGLELGMAPRRSGGYLAPVGPDEQPVGLNPDNFQELKRLLTEAQAVLKRESAAK